MFLKCFDFVLFGLLLKEVKVLKLFAPFLEIDEVFIKHLHLIKVV